jgi:RND family efflux transporter MFP subunit
MRSWVRPWVSVRQVGLGLALLLSWIGCGEEPPPAEPVVRPVKILELRGASAGRIREYPGEIQAAQNADIGFEVAGKLIEFPVKESQRVEIGQVLAKLDPRDYQTDLDAARASARAAKADFERYRALFRENVASKQELEKYERNYDVFEAKVASAQKAVEDAVLRAPFAGVIARKLVDDFSNVQAKEPVVTLQTGSSLEIIVAFPEQDYARIRRGATVEELNESLVADVIVSALPGQKFPAKLKEFATTADPVTRTFQATFSFDAPPDVNVLPGMTAKLVGATRQGARGASFSVPVQAAAEDEGGKPYVWLVDPQSMKARKVYVTLGELSGSSVQVTSGLVDGAWVVTSGVHQLREGMEVSREGD